MNPIKRHRLISTYWDTWRAYMCSMNPHSLQEHRLYRQRRDEHENAMINMVYHGITLSEANEWLAHNA